jgi:predicted dehydrogenase
MEVYEANAKSRQYYNRALRLTPSGLEAHAQECVEYARAIVNGDPSPVPPEQSLQVMAILDGIYRSQEAGREVALEV